MTNGKEYIKPNSDGENEFRVRTIISRLDKIHHVLKEVEEIKDSLVSMATVFDQVKVQRAEFEQSKRRQDEKLSRAEKKIEDLNKENEQLKSTYESLEKCFKRCSVDLRRMPLLQIQPEKNCPQSVNIPQQEEEIEIIGISKTGRQNTRETSSQDCIVRDSPVDLKPIIEFVEEQQNENPTFPLVEYQPTSANAGDGERELPVEASTSFSSSEVILPESMDYLPVIKTEDPSFYENEGCSIDINEQQLSVPSGSELPLATVQQFTSEATFYQCGICQAIFNCWSLLEGHRKRHGDRTGLKKHKCTHCSYSSNHLNDLRNHTRTHTKERPYECVECHKGFTQRSSLRRHVRTHTKEKPYKCNVCNKAFIDASRLQMHIRTHTKEKPYMCRVCHKAFSDSRTLKNHTRTHAS